MLERFNFETLTDRQVLHPFPHTCEYRLKIKHFYSNTKGTSLENNEDNDINNNESVPSEAIGYLACFISFLVSRGPRSMESPSCMSDSLLAMAMAAYLTWREIHPRFNSSEKRDFFFCPPWVGETYFWCELAASEQMTVSFLRPQSHCKATWTTWRCRRRGQETGISCVMFGVLFSCCMSLKNSAEDTTADHSHKFCFMPQNSIFLVSCVYNYK